MKKFLDFILGGAGALLGLLTVILMNGTGASASAFGVTASVSVFDVMNGHDFKVGLLFAMIFAIIAICYGLFIIVLKLINKKFGFEQYGALAVAVLSLIGGILYFCTASFAGSGLSLGAGAVFCAIFSLLNAGVFAFYGVSKIIR